MNDANSNPTTPKTRRWLVPRFSLRTMLVLITLFGVTFGVWCERAERQRRVVETLSSLRCDYEFASEPAWINWLPQSMQDFHGGHYWRSVGSISYPRREAVATIEGTHDVLVTCGQLPGLNRLHLNAEVAENDWQEIASIPGLEQLAFKAKVVGQGDVASLRKLHRLRMVDGSLENVDGDVESIRHLAELTSLTSLDIRFCNDEGLHHLAPLTHLESLHIEGGDFTGDDFDRLRNLPLTFLSLPAHTFSDKGGATLALFTSLQDVELHDTNVGNETAKALGSLPRLKSANIDCTLLDDEGAAALAKSTSLTTLSVGYTAIGTKGVAALVSSPTLTYLDLSGIRVSRSELVSFAASPALEDVELARDADSGFVTISRQRWLELATEMPDGNERRALWLSPQELVESFRVEFAKAKESQRLQLEEHEPEEEAFDEMGVEEDGEEENVEEGEEAEQLEMPHWDEDKQKEWRKVLGPFSDERLKLVATIPEITSLDLSSSIITNAGLAALPTMEWLESLDCSNTRISSDGLKHLAQLPKLRELDLSGCQNIDGSALDILHQMPSLQELNVKGTSLTRDEVVQIVRLKQFGFFNSDFGQVIGKTPDVRMAFYLGKIIARPGLVGYGIKAVKGAWLPSSTNGPPLDLSNDGPLTPEQVAQLAKETELWQLWAELDDERFEALNDLSQLAELGLVGPKVGKPSIRHALARQDLQALMFRAVRFTSDDWAELRGAKIKSLVLDNLDVSEDCVQAMATMPQLDHVTLKGSATTDQAVSRLGECCPNLKALSFEAARCSTAVVRRAIRQLPNLQSLYLGQRNIPFYSLMMLRGQEAYDQFEEKTLGGPRQPPADKQSRPGGQNVALTGPWVDDAIGLPDGNLVVVNWVQLRDASITGTTIRRIADYDLLRRLDLSGCSIRDSDMEAVHEFVYLQSLALNDCAISGETLKRFAHCRSLMMLELARTKIDDQSLSVIRSFGRLRTLDLSGTAITDQGLDALAAAKTIDTLHLSATKISDAGLKQIGGLMRLRNLDLSYTAISDEGMTAVGSLLRLQQLDLRATEVTDAGLDLLTGLRHAEFIDLRETQVTADGAAKLREALPWCRILLADADGVMAGYLKETD